MVGAKEPPCRMRMLQRRRVRPRRRRPAQRIDRPPFAPLSAKQQQRLDQILAYWQHTSSRIKTYACRFTRFEYDHVFGPQDKNRHKTQSEGVIRYAAPDKGEFRVERLGTYTPPAEPGRPPTYPMKPAEELEHWICDGQAVYELNGQTKQLIVQSLPPEMQGKFIADGPLPFMFGASKEKILGRYWMRELPPPAERRGEYWLEAWPKRREDAANFQRIMIILDEKTFLPKAMQIFPPSYEERENTSREVYTFADLQVNDPIHRGQEFMGGFISPRKPLGWKKVVTNYGQSPGPATASNPPAGKTKSPAQRRMRWTACVACQIVSRGSQCGL